MNKPETLKIDDIEYVRKDRVNQSLIKGNRAIIVVDRGWIFAGDVARKDGRIILTNAVLVQRWESIGFDGMIADPKSKKVFIKPIVNGVDIPSSTELFCVPVPDGWGL